MTDLAGQEQLRQLRAQKEEKLRQLYELERAKKEIKDRQLKMARKSFRHFCEYVMRDEYTGNTIRLADIHLTWIKHINFAWSNGLHAAILAPYGHGKTSEMAVGLPLFTMGRNPQSRIVIASANDKIARERVVMIRQYIDKSEAYHEVFPNIQADTDVGWTKTELYVKKDTISKDATLTAAGITSSNIGKRVDLFVFDDVNDAKNTIREPRTRDTIWMKYTGELMSRLERWGKVVIIATRWHEEDLIGKILKDEDMRNTYAFLIQRVTEEFDAIECETIIPKVLTKRNVHSELDNLMALYDAGVLDGV